MNLEVLTNADELAARAAEIILAQSRAVVSQRGNFTIALSGGATPKRLYELLSNPAREFYAQLPWSAIQFFWTDERHVGPENSDNNFHMTYEAMLGRVPVPKENVHRIPAEDANAAKVAGEYERILVEFFELSAGSAPRFDLILLGMGNDGHTASLFPGTEVLNERTRLVAAPWVEKLNGYRFTMTLPVLNNAATVVFLVCGEEKSGILKEVLEGPPDQYPAQAIKPATGQLTWLIDRAAASKLKS